MKKILLGSGFAVIAGCATAPQPALDQGTYDAAARERWSQAALKGDAQAQYELGNAYCCGEDGYWDTRIAVRWWCAAASQGLAQARAALESHNIAVAECELAGSAKP
jgi:TPR repeat protein